VGRLEPGAEADVVVLTEELELQRVLAAGEDVLA
jgi:N-acetylglucosamine-6-phosphate deacetylase